MVKDYAEELVERRAKKNPAMRKMVKAAMARQELGHVLAKKREKLGMTQAEVAARMKTSRPVVARIELGGDVQISTLERYLATMNMELRLSAVTA